MTTQATVLSLLAQVWRLAAALLLSSLCLSAMLPEPLQEQASRSRGAGPPRRRSLRSPTSEAMIPLAADIQDAVLPLPPPFFLMLERNASFSVSALHPGNVAWRSRTREPWVSKDSSP